MNIPKHILIRCCWELVLLTSSSFVFWLVLESLKPGFVSHWWNLPLHFNVSLLLLLFVSLVLGFPEKVPNTPTQHRISELLLPLGGAIVIMLLLHAWGLPGILLGLITWLALIIIEHTSF